MPSLSTLAAPTAHTAPAPDRHKRLCAVCKHRHRAAIEEAFLRWQSVQSIADYFKLPDRASLYRHAHALSLFARRKANISSALEHILEKSMFVDPSASAVIDAVRAYAHLDETGRWIKRPAIHYIIRKSLSRPKRRASNRKSQRIRK